MGHNIWIFYNTNFKRKYYNTNRSMMLLKTLENAQQDLGMLNLVLTSTIPE